MQNSTNFENQQFNFGEYLSPIFVQNLFSPNLKEEIVQVSPFLGSLSDNWFLSYCQNLLFAKDCLDLGHCI